MGTRGHVVVVDGSGKRLVRIYRQFDTYPTGMGADLLSILGQPKLVNGYGRDDGIPEVFNGMGCLAAYLVGKLKADEIGNVYLHATDEEPDGVFIEWVYTLTPGADDRLWLQVEMLGGGTYTIVYDGPFAEFDPSAVANVEA